MKNRFLLPIFLIVVVDVLGLTIVLPLLPFYAEKFGASPTVVGLLVTTYAACQLIASPLLGRLSDRFGRRPCLLVSQVGTFIGFLILAFSNTLWLIFLSRFIDGITAGNLSLAQAYISDVTEPKDRTKAFGIIGIAFGLGFLFGPAVSGFLSQFGYHYPVFAAAALSMGSIFATYFLLPEKIPASEGGSQKRTIKIVDWSGYRKYFQEPALFSGLWQFTFFAFSFSLFVSGFALFAERRFTYAGNPFGPAEVGYVFAYSGFLGILLQAGLIGRLAHKFGEQKLSMAAFLASSAGYVILGYSYGFVGLLLANTLSAAGNGILRPALTSLISQRAERSEQGAVLGLTQSLNSLAQIIAPLVAGTLIELKLLTGWAIAAACTTLLGFLIAQRRPKPASARPV